MQEPQELVDEQYMLDGNAAAGLLREVFACEMTLAPAQCVHCGTISEIGAMLLFGREMGAVLYCPVCRNVVMRAVQRNGEIWVDMQGVSCLRLARAEP